MSAKILLDRIIPAREFFSLELRNGDILRVIDVEGKQVVDLVALNASNKNDRAAVTQISC
jgi:uncharacterized protein YcgI (DUF1989 family)